MRLFLPTALLLTLVAATPAVFAETPPEYNRVTMNESAQADVENDLLVAVLFAQAEGREATNPADEVNRVMDWAVNLAKAHPEVKLQTLGYHTQPVYNKGSIRGWRVNQSLRLESRDGRLLGDLLARLQEQMQVQSIAYQVSTERRRETVEALTAEALQRFEARARHVAETLGRNGYRLVRININDGYQGPAPIARSMMLEAAAADAGVAPARIEAGTQQVTVSVSGEIELNDK